MRSASIVLLTCDGENYLKQILQMIRRQKNQPLEVLGFDSESKDSTLQIFKEFQIPVTRIKRSEFSHSRTRNLAARLCSGKYIVFLTQDAIPADSCWLETLLKPFAEFENLAGCYSRQIPHPGCSPLQASDLKREFPLNRFVKSPYETELLKEKQIWNLIHFSNSSSVYVRELLLRYPFDEHLEMAEDQEWTKRMLEQGFTFVYEPSSVVVHSHEHTLGEQCARNASMGKSFSTFLYPILGRRSGIREISACLFHIYLDFRYILTSGLSVNEKVKSMFLSPVYRTATHYAFRKGWNSVRKPSSGTVSIPGHELA